MGKSKKIKKTNAMRVVEDSGFDYVIFTYPWKEDTNAQETALAIERPEGQVYKTIVLVDEKKEPLVAVIPSHKEIDLKKLALAAGHKRVETLPLRDLEKTTGYMRGGCSPIAMRKKFPTYLAQEANELDEIIVSAGKRGLQIGLGLEAFKMVTEAQLADITT